MYLTFDPEVAKYKLWGLETIDLIILPWVSTCILGYLFGSLFQRLKKASVKSAKETGSLKRSSVILVYVLLFALNILGQWFLCGRIIEKATEDGNMGHMTQSVWLKYYLCILVFDAAMDFLLALIV